MNHSEAIIPKWKLNRQCLSSFLSPNCAWCWLQFYSYQVLFVLFLFLVFLFTHTSSFSPYKLFFSMRTLLNFVLLLLLSSLCEMILFLQLCGYVSLIKISCLVLDPNLYTNLILPYISTSYYVTETHCASIQILYLLPQISSHIPWVSIILAIIPSNPF